MLKDGITKNNIKEASEHLNKVLASSDFLNNKGLDNEVPFHICPYSPTIQNDITHLIKQLSNNLKKIEIKSLEINLYDLSIELLKKEDDWDWFLEKEETMTRDRLQEELQSILDVETILTPAIVKKMNVEEHDVLFLTGIGEVFPYIRSHNVLNNLQKEAKEKPTIMFFPGEYKHSLESGAALVLFGQLQDDKYYRAFNILDRAI